MTGSFSLIRSPSGKRQVTARFIGYKQQTLEAQVADGRSAVLHFELIPDVNELTDIEGIWVRGKQPEN